MRATSLCMCVSACVCVESVQNDKLFPNIYYLCVLMCLWRGKQAHGVAKIHTHKKNTELIRSFFVSSRARISLGCGRHWSWSLAGAVGGRRVNANLPQQWWRTHIIASRGEAQAERVRDRIQNVRAVCAKFRRRSGDVRFFGVSPASVGGESGRE